MEIAELTRAEQDTAAARTRLYRLLADGFLYPDASFFADLKDGHFRDAVQQACEALPHDLSAAFDGLVAAGDYTDFQAEYLRLFEVGLGIPPCPLYSGLYRGGRKTVMEELTRFYSYFGLSIEHGGGELPDHLVTELEFMHFLAFKELAAWSRGEDAASYRRAQADFLERQLLSWLPALDQRIQPLDPPPFYVALTWLANAFAQAELARLRAEAEQPVSV